MIALWLLLALKRCSAPYVERPSAAPRHDEVIRASLGELGDHETYGRGRRGGLPETEIGAI